MTRDTRAAGADPNAEFERKVRLSRAALVLERLWPRLWVLAGLVGLFVAVSLAGVWQMLPDVGHMALLAAFGLAAIGALVWMARTPGATREAAIRRIEQRSGVAHRPASRYEDHLTAASENPATEVLWAEHRARIARQLAKLKVGLPEARTARLDPFALVAREDRLGAGERALSAVEVAPPRLHAGELWLELEERHDTPQEVALGHEVRVIRGAGVAGGGCGTSRHYHP